MGEDSDRPGTRVLVVGATGKQGGAGAQHLLGAGMLVRALTRNPDKPAARTLADRGAEGVAGDLGDADSVRRALAGVSAVFCVTNFYEAGYAGEVAQGELMVDLAAAAGVGHFVFSSVCSADKNTGIPHFDSKYQVERYLAAGSVPFTVVRPVFLMENWELYRKAIGGGWVVSRFSRERPLQQVSVEDSGAFSLIRLPQPDRGKGGSVDLAGDDLSMTETAEAFARVTQRPVAMWQISWDDFRDQQGEEMYVMNRWFETTGYHADLNWLRQGNPQILTLQEDLRHD